MRSNASAIAVMIFLTLAGCGSQTQVSLGPSSEGTGLLVATDGVAPVYVMGSGFTSDEATRLSAVASSPFGPQGNSLVQRSEGDVWYLSATREEPAGELHLMKDGQDHVLLKRVTSFAVSTNGAVAYTHSGGDDLISTIIVRQPDGTEAEWWSEFGAYRLVSWVDDGLLVEEQQPEGQPPTIVYLSGPGRRLELAQRAAVSAVDANEVLLSTMTDAGQPAAVLVDARTAKSLAVVDLAALDMQAAIGFAVFDDDGSVIASVLEGDGNWALTQFKRIGSALTPVSSIALPSDLPTGLYDLSIEGEWIFGLAQLAVMPDKNGNVPADALTTEVISCTFSTSRCESSPLYAGPYQVDRVEEVDE